MLTDRYRPVPSATLPTPHTQRMTTQVSPSVCISAGLPSSGPCVSNGPCGAFAICQVAGAFLWERAECACMDGFVKKTQTATECHPVDSLSTAVKVQGGGEDLAFPPLQLAAMASGSQEDTNSKTDHSSDVFFSLPKAKAEEEERQKSWGSLGSSSTPPQPAVGPRSTVDILSDTPAPFVFQQAKKEPQQDASSAGSNKTKTPPNKAKNKPSPHQKQQQQRQQQQQGPGKQKAKAPGPMAMAKKEKENNRMAKPKWQQAAEAAMAAKRRRRGGGGVMTATTAALSQAADGPLLNLGRLVAGGLPTGLMGGRG